MVARRPPALLPIFGEVSDWVQEESGLELVLDDRSFQRKRNKLGNPTTQGRISYRGPNANPTMPKVKLDLTSDEVLVDRPAFRRIGHPYSDQLPVDGVLCYSITELFGEKLRALAEGAGHATSTTWSTCIATQISSASPGVCAALSNESCGHADIDVPTGDTIRDSPFRAEIESEWENMLGHQLPKPLVPFKGFWASLDDVFSWLAGTLRTQALPRAEYGKLDAAWEAPKAITSWRRRVPLELLRYAGANRVMVDVDYRAEQGKGRAHAVSSHTPSAAPKTATSCCSWSTTTGNCEATESTGLPRSGPRPSSSLRSSESSSDSNEPDGRYATRRSW